MRSSAAFWKTGDSECATGWPRITRRDGRSRAITGCRPGDASARAAMRSRTRADLVLEFVERARYTSRSPPNGSLTGRVRRHSANRGEQRSCGRCRRELRPARDGAGPSRGSGRASATSSGDSCRARCSREVDAVLHAPRAGSRPTPAHPATRWCRRCATSMSASCALARSVRRAMPSASGLRQVFPVQTKSTMHGLRYRRRGRARTSRSMARRQHAGADHARPAARAVDDGGRRATATVDRHRAHAAARDGSRPATALQSPPAVIAGGTPGRLALVLVIGSPYAAGGAAVRDAASSERRRRPRGRAAAPARGRSPPRSTSVSGPGQNRAARCAAYVGRCRSSRATCAGSPMSSRNGLPGGRPLSRTSDSTDS